ncbi:Polygalacturonase [Granulicella rosea]|uniref:Polygalacturonase n=1 Tax=Granulicella rosea TaxID=474952 RepID=A0A239CU94_9BACT|nr:glycosyl hydrolase family 28-related protein [Granulicella rosea]SNS23211.1 Polygalacturonase [Granulicella rosea]
MKPTHFDNARRDLLKFTGIGLAAALPSTFAAAQASPSGSTTPLMVFDVRRFGATGSGKQLDTPAINAAIAAANAAGGGTVYFPAGTYLCFSIRLKSNVALYIDQGATILAADSPLPGQTTGQLGGTYDAAEPNTAWDAYQDYGHNHWHNSLMWGEDIHDFAILGPGLIHGKGLSFGAGPGKYNPAEANPSFGGDRSAKAKYTPRGNYVMFQAEQPGVGNKAIALKNCRNVILRDFSILKGGHFGLLLTGVDNLTIDNLKIDTDRDGMDIDCCKNVRVSNCTVNSPWDDGICPKTSYALGYARSTENVTISNCYVTGYYELGTILDGTFKKMSFDSGGKGFNGRIKCGTESNGGFKNITISNCIFEGCQGLALESEDGALCEDITITNITLRDMFTGPLFFRLGARLRGPKETTKVGTLRRILVSNITSYNGLSRIPSVLSGIPGYPIEDIKIANYFSQDQGGGSAEWARLTPPEEVAKYPDPPMFGTIPASGLYLRHIRNLEMSHVEVSPMKPDARAAFYLQGVDRADFISCTAPGPAFRLNEVTDLRILLSRAAKDTILPKANNQTL